MKSQAIDVPMMRYLLALLEERSVSKAAVRCGVSQPTMSHGLARMRELFDDPLLIVAHGKMVPTMRAQALHIEIAAIVAAIDALVAKDDGFDPMSSTCTLVISSSEMYEYLLMPALMARLQKEAPKVRLQFRQPDRTMVETWLAQGKIDFRLAFLPDPGESLRSRRLFEDQWTCVARDDHPTIRGAMTLDQYASASHVCIDLLGLTTGEQMIDQTLARHAVARENKVLIQSHLAAPHVVAASDCVATLPLGFARSFSHLPLQFIDPPVALTPMVCSIYWHERTHREPSHIWFRQVLAEVAQQVIKPPPNRT